MITGNPQMRPRQRGIVLITSMLLLLVVTIMAVSMFRSFGTQEKIAVTCARSNAPSTLPSARSSTPSGGWSARCPPPASCSGMVNSNIGQVCTNLVADFTAVPWKIAGAPVASHSRSSPPTYQRRSQRCK